MLDWPRLTQFQLRPCMGKLSWTALGTALTSSTSRVIYALPIAGYVILYSDYFQKLFHFSLLTEDWGFLSFTMRINFIYYGSLLLFAAFLLWVSFCPPLLRGKKDLQHFVTDIIMARDRTAVLTVANSPLFGLSKADVSPVLDEKDLISFSEVTTAIRSRGTLLGDGAGEYEHRIPEALALYFKWQNVTRPWLRGFIAALAGAGFLFVLVLPSFDLFLKVLGTHYKHLFG